MSIWEASASMGTPPREVTQSAMTRASMALDNAGNLYVADLLNHRIRKINLTTKVITTVAGIGTPGYSGDLGPATSAQLKLPSSVAIETTVPVGPEPALPNQIAIAAGVCTVSLRILSLN